MAQILGEAVLACIFAIIRFAKPCFRRFGHLESDRAASGEAAVRRWLDELPDEFRVIHDLATPFGKIDHVVVGPTGLFILDTRDWPGIVAADGNGELTLNGNPLDEPYVEHFLARIMDLKANVRVLASGLDPYFQAVFVFTSARVEARFGTTNSVHCIRDQQLLDYIVNKRFGKKLPAAEVKKLARAFLALAQMEDSFSDSAAPAAPVRPAGRYPEPRPLATRRRADEHRLVEANA